jgi:hypothetical protein
VDRIGDEKEGDWVDLMAWTLGESTLTLASLYQESSRVGWPGKLLIIIIRVGTAGDGASLPDAAQSNAEPSHVDGF